MKQIKKSDKLLVRLTKAKTKTQITRISIEIRATTADLTEFFLQSRITIKAHFEQLYANKLEN